VEREVFLCQSDRTQVAFWDVDAPATLERVETDTKDPFRELIGRYDYILTYGGGKPIMDHYSQLGAKACFAIYNALDPDTHHPVEPDPELSCDLAFVGNRLPDRESRVEEFFLAAATLAPEMSFVLGGEGWAGKPLPQNVRWIGHVGSDRHNLVNCSARMVLNINRDSMARVGFSPPTRVFEAAGAGSCVITDFWEGIETFFVPGVEILPAASASDVVAHLRSVGKADALKIGAAMRDRAILDHTYKRRAAQVHAIVQRFADRKPARKPKAADPGSIYSPV
jgi:spore maturation protein CgeB